MISFATQTSFENVLPIINRIFCYITQSFEVDLSLLKENTLDTVNLSNWFEYVKKKSIYKITSLKCVYLY